MYMCAHVYATEYTWQSEDNLCELVSTMWIPGIELRSLGFGNKRLYPVNLLIGPWST